MRLAARRPEAPRPASRDVRRDHLGGPRAGRAAQRGHALGRVVLVDPELDGRGGGRVAIPPIPAAAARATTAHAAGMRERRGEIRSRRRGTMAPYRTHGPGRSEHAPRNRNGSMRVLTRVRNAADPAALGSVLRSAAGQPGRTTSRPAPPRARSRPAPPSRTSRPRRRAGRRRRAAEQPVAAALAEDPVGPRAAGAAVRAGPQADDVGPAAAEHHVVAAAGGDHVAAGRPEDAVAPPGADERGGAPAAAQGGRGSDPGLLPPAPGAPDVHRHRDPRGEPVRRADAVGVSVPVKPARGV